MNEINSFGDTRLPERFWSKIEVTETGCWLWTGSVKAGVKPYAFFNWGGKTRVAHRVSYEVLVEPIREGLVIDHMCHTPRCVNPAHLQTVTQKQNLENRVGPDVDSTSGIRGVYWVPRKKRWAAQVVHHGKCYHGGNFVSKERAGEVALAMRNELFTNNLNDPRGEAA